MYEAAAPLEPARRRAVRVEENHGLHQPRPPPRQPHQHIRPEPRGQPDETGYTEMQDLDSSLFFTQHVPPQPPGSPEVVADVLEALRQLLHAGEGLLLLQRRGARLLPGPRHVVDREVAGDEAEAGTNQR